MKFKLRPEIHPALFSVAPALLLVSHNPGQAFLSDALFPIGITLLGVFFLWVVLSCFLSDRKKVGIIISIFLFVFFSFGHFQIFLRYYFVSPLLGELVRPRYLLLFCIVFIVLSSYLIIKTHKNLSQSTIFLNFMSLALVVLPLIQIASFSLQASLGQNKSGGMDFKAVVEDASKTQKVFPDIYYIILDAYARESTLRDHLNYNNQDFIDHLKEKGFYVASKSRSNYGSTALSLASSLNMEYINHLSRVVESGSSNPYFAWKMVEDNKVMHFLRSRGYKIINFNSGWHPTRKLQIADINVHCTHSKQFNSVFIETTLYNIFEKRFHLVTDYRKHHLCTFSKVAEYSKTRGPKFIFAHMVIPHEPYVFGPNGEAVSGDEIKDCKCGFTRQEAAKAEVPKQRYLGQLTFLNKKIEEMIEQILPKSPPFPIIILQSDHGAKSDVIPLEIYARERLKNFTAYYLPEKGGELLYDSISPVNTFRLIFSHYLNGNYDLLEDRSYYSSAFSHIYDFVELNPEENFAGAKP